jgi:hypothetical protein
MNMNFDEMSGLLFQTLESVLPARSCAYVAGPIDSGPAYYGALSSGVDASHVREENEQRLRAFVDLLRARLDCPVFDPSILRIESWTPNQHGDFFIRVLERFAKEVWFIDGWEFSHGATKEFVNCVRLGIPCLNEAGLVFDAPLGEALIREASDYVDSLGLDGSRLRSRLK